MFDLTRIRSLSDFQRNTRAHIQRLKESGKPEVLTVNGQAELVVQDAGSYQRLMEAADEARFLQALRASIDQADRNEGRPLRDALTELAGGAGISLPQ
ncbi:MAG: type II toxin-antitoxin system Phd/YefM family antitoxin [Phycisphaerae bacterium]|nr:type II toxin-antitoxin system Phd/YefM family antitoxin [Phycisphaerae bacterium]NUQ44831.1 type II toxin-antitoxin system Phd/YefM family antitoxin [Phycisphaerae bacterium]